MAVDWWMNWADPQTGETIGDEGFGPTGYEMEDIDFMLLGGKGRWEIGGPLKKLWSKGTSLPSECPESLCSPQHVRRCAKELTAIPADQRAPLEQVLTKLNWSLDQLDEEGRQQFYDDLVKAAHDFRAFIATAAEQGYAVKIGIAA